MKFFTAILLMASIEGFAFEGQPSRLALLKNSAETVEVQLPNFTRSTFKPLEEPCEEVCYRALEFKNPLQITVGEVAYDSHRFVVKVDPQGELVIDENEPATLHLQEVLTKTALTFSLNGRSVSCFGSHSKSFCTNFAILERY